jgi:hypothetical protein
VKLAVITGRKEHADRINEAWQHGVDAVIETGMRIIDARGALEHGEYIAMVENDLHFKRSMAFKFVAIASNKVLSNGSHGKHLPTAWTVLYDLSAAGNKGFDLEAGIEGGAIHPKMGRKDVKALLPSSRQKKKRRRGKPLPLPTPPANTEHERELDFLRSAWASAGPEARRGFVRACWIEIMWARDQIGSANLNGNGADHEAQPSTENAEASDRWIEGDSL